MAPKIPPTELQQIATHALADLATNEPIGGLRLHLIQSPRSTNGKTTVRLWHPDGIQVATASGWGYDRTGAAFAKALEVLIPADLLRLNDLAYLGVDGVRPYWAGALRWTSPQARQIGTGPEAGGQGHVSLDGAIGMSTVINMLAAIGLLAEVFDTSGHSQIVFIRRVS